MIEISEAVYRQKFDKIYQWILNHLYGNDNYSFHLIDVPNSHLKILEIEKLKTHGIYFRILIKLAYYNLDTAKLSERDVRELDQLYNTKSKKQFNSY